MLVSFQDRAEAANMPSAKRRKTDEESTPTEVPPEVFVQHTVNASTTKPELDRIAELVLGLLPNDDSDLYGALVELKEALSDADEEGKALLIVKNRKSAFAAAVWDLWFRARR